MMSEVALILFNIPSSTAFIERFYSLCGNVCKNKSGNMTARTISQRSFLKANFHILNSLSVEPLLRKEEAKKQKKSN